MAAYDLDAEMLIGEHRRELSSRYLENQEGREFEIKYHVDDFATLENILKSFPQLQFKRRRPVNTVSLAFPKLFYKDNRLLNYALDTVDNAGQGEFQIYSQAGQLRMRAAVRPDYEQGHPMAIDSHQCSFKNLFSQGTNSDRDEIESLVDGFQNGPAQFLKDKADKLPGFFSKIDPGNLRIVAAFLTSRVDTGLFVYLKEEDVGVFFKPSHDVTRNFTGGLTSVTNKDGLEWEAEADSVVFFSDKPAVNEDRDFSYRTYLFAKAELVLRDHLEKAPFAGQIHRAMTSKTERAINDVSDYYAPQVAFLRASVATGKVNLLRPELGAFHAAGHNIMTSSLDAKMERFMLTRANEMIAPCNIFNDISGIEKVRFEQPRTTTVEAPTPRQHRIITQLAYA